MLTEKTKNIFSLVLRLGLSLLLLVGGIVRGAGRDQSGHRLRGPGGRRRRAILNRSAGARRFTGAGRHSGRGLPERSVDLQPAVGR